jgi:hypothetical protein
MLPRAWPHPFPATRRATLLVLALLAAHVLLALVALQAALAFVELTWRLVAGRDELRPVLAAHLGQFRLLRALQGGLWVLTWATFVGWVGRAQRDLTALGATGVRSPGQARAAFLVPGLNLVRPVGVLGELWSAGRSSAGVPPRTPIRIRWWWGLLLAAVTTEVTARLLAWRSGTALDIGPAMQALIVSQLLTAAAGVTGMVVVYGVDARHDAAAWAETR